MRALIFSLLTFVIHPRARVNKSGPDIAREGFIRAEKAREQREK